MKFLIVGIGSIGRRHFQNLRALGFRNVAVTDPRRSFDGPQRAFFKKYSPKIFTDLTTALNEYAPHAVIVANPTSFHVETALRSIRRGAHVFIEKPVSHSRRNLNQLLREAKKGKEILYVGYHFRHHPQLRLIKRYLGEGRIGKILWAYFVSGEYLPSWHPWEDYRKSYAAKERLGGGVVLTQSHDLDTAYWFFGKPTGVSATLKKSGMLDVDVEDIAEMVFAFEHCPVVAIHLDYLLRPSVKQCVILGTKGRIEWDYYAGTLVILQGEKRKVLRLPKRFQRNHMYFAEVKDFIRCIRRRIHPAVDGQAGATVLSMALKAKESSQKQRAVFF